MWPKALYGRRSHHLHQGKTGPVQSVTWQQSDLPGHSLIGKGFHQGLQHCLGWAGREQKPGVEMGPLASYTEGHLVLHVPCIPRTLLSLPQKEGSAPGHESIGQRQCLFSGRPLLFSKVIMFECCVTQLCVFSLPVTTKALLWALKSCDCLLYSHLQPLRMCPTQQVPTLCWAPTALQAVSTPWHRPVSGSSSSSAAPTSSTTFSVMCAPCCSSPVPDTALNELAWSASVVSSS